jgi:phenylpropionate dioxygenase-like ring-hydroxylating dioxygenase large terminal subunit
VSGTCRQIVCKYHGWRYDLDGSCSYVTGEEDFFGLDRKDYGMVPIHCDVWEGFIFINFAREPAQSLRDFLGPMIRSVEGYPFHLHTERYSYRAKVNSNWKLFFDAFQEYYHAPTLHAIQYWKRPQEGTEKRSSDALAGIRGGYYEIDGPHRMQSTGGNPYGRDLPPEYVKPIERVLRSDLIGPWDGPDFSKTAPGLNPGGMEPWTTSAFHFFPNFTILFRGLGWYLTYTYWPTSFNTHIFEGNLYFVPSKDARERLAHELVRATHKEYALQDSNTLEATQRMLESGVVKDYPLGDHEVMCRHLHKVIGDWVTEYKLQLEKGDEE